MTQGSEGDTPRYMGISGQRDTIAAIATPPGQGGIGIVRISGQAARAVLAGLWRGRPAAGDFESHRLYYGPVGDAGDAADVIDRVFAVWMGAPKTYTGEDVVEISGHGGHAVMQRLLQACLNAGARAAQPGEFTRRAYLCGKIDLTQAEAVADVIAASSDAQLTAAQRQLEGRLSRAVDELCARIISARAFVEAAIDFPEEDIDIIRGEGPSEEFALIAADAARLSATFSEGRLIREGVRVVIAGLPNAGKSSLLNALSGHERAIVHHEPGTTRDVVEASIELGGMVFHLRDTAGLREPNGEVEHIGIDRARNEMLKADIVIYVVDATVGVTDEDGQNMSAVPEDKRVVVYNKIDAVDLQRDSGSRADGDVKAKAREISALKGSGLDALKEGLLALVRSQAATETHGAIVTNVRHKSALDEAVGALSRARGAMTERASGEFVAHHLRCAHESLARITGSIADDALLDEIFSRFCIGK